MKKTLVRCLGPGAEHWFYSKNPKHNRICSRCVDRQRYAGVPKIFEKVYKLHQGRKLNTIEVPD